MEKSATKISNVSTSTAPVSDTSAASEAKPLVPLGITEFFVRRRDTQSPVQYKPKIAGMAKLHFIDSKTKVDSWQDVCIIASAEDDGKTVHWDEGENLPDVRSQLEKSALPSSTFAEIPAGLIQEKNYALFEKAFADFLYQNQVLTIYRTKELNLISKEGESEGDFRARISLTFREKRDELIKKLKDKYADKMATLTDKVRRAQEKMGQKQQKAGLQKVETLISFGSTLLGAFLGHGMTKGTISQAGTSMKKAGKITKDSQDVSQAEQDYRTCMQQLDDLQGQLNNEIANIATTDSTSIQLETITVRPRKSDISVEKVVLAWWPS
jgi:hypothetical protein